MSGYIDFFKIWEVLVLFVIVVLLIFFIVFVTIIPTVNINYSNKLYTILIGLAALYLIYYSYNNNIGGLDIIISILLLGYFIKAYYIVIDVITANNDPDIKSIAITVRNLIYLAIILIIFNLIFIGIAFLCNYNCNDYKTQVKPEDLYVKMPTI
jgi:hypothetical protein